MHQTHLLLLLRSPCCFFVFLWSQQNQVMSNCLGVSTWNVVNGSLLSRHYVQFMTGSVYNILWGENERDEYLCRTHGERSR